MMKVKLFIAGLVFGILLLALASSDARVSGDQDSFTQDSFLPSIETITETVQSTQSVDVSTDSSANIDINSSSTTESSTDVSSSSTIDVQMDMNTEGSVSSQSVEVNVNGQNISCGPGDNYQSPTVKCRNRGGNIDLDYRLRSD